MRRRRTVIATMGLMLALLPLVAAVSSGDGTSPANSESQPRVPVAIAQPLAAIDRPLVAAGHQAIISESGMLVLVGSALLGLASVVGRTTAP
jgi:hypothetical protein